LARRRPFRAPHHTASTAALVGGGSNRLRPGEVTLTHGEERRCYLAVRQYASACRRTSVRATVSPVADLPIRELVENRRRSVAMLPVGAPALNRDEALKL